MIVGAKGFSRRHSERRAPVSSLLMAIDRNRTVRGAIAGAAAAGVWALLQPLDKKPFGVDYDDVELLGKFVTRGPAWRPIGLAMHIQNGALFGAVYANVVRRTPLPRPIAGTAAGLIEHVASWPGVKVTDRFHPAREELVTMSGNRRAWWQAAWRHFVFGTALGVFELWLNPEEPAEEQ